MSGYLRPVDAPISCSWGCHLDRNPPSSEAGTDYAVAYGTPARAVGDGVVTYVKHSTSGAMGRVAEYALDDGRHTRSIHLSEVWVGVGQRVARGQHIGLSGASGFDSDWGYAAHLHHTLWPGPAWAAPTIDFELYVGEDEEDDMTPEQAELLRNIGNDTDWIKARIGGSLESDDDSLQTLAEQTRKRVGGSTANEDPALTTYAKDTRVLAFLGVVFGVAGVVMSLAAAALFTLA